MRYAETESEPPVLRFYNKVIREYNCGDVKWLLQRKTPTLGPLLACVGAGVDTVGGMMYGFEKGSQSRSVQFLKDVVGIDATVAEAIYCCARCGYMHDGIGSLSFGWFADYKRIKPGAVLFRRKDGGLALNVVELAHKYLDAVERVWKDCQDQLRHIPAASPKVVTLVASLSSARLPSLEEFLDECGEEAELRGSYSHEDIMKGIGYWSYEGYAKDDE